MQKVSPLILYASQTKNAQGCRGVRPRAVSSKMQTSLVESSIRKYILGLFQVCTAESGCVSHQRFNWHTVNLTRSADGGEDGCLSLRVCVLVRYQRVNSGMTAAVRNSVHVRGKYRGNEVMGVNGRMVYLAALTWNQPNKIALFYSSGILKISHELNQ